MTPELTLYILEKEHPRVAQAIQERLRAILPAKRFKDLSQLPQLLTAFCQVRGIREEVLKGQLGNGTTQYQVARYRREFGGVLLLCYQPEKMYGMTERMTLKFLPKAFSKEVKCCDRAGKAMLREVPVHFKYYPDFKQTVLHTHEQIITQLTTDGQ